MCHIGTGNGYSHGPRFQRKMRRVAQFGEPKLLEDVERYDGTDAARAIEALRVAGRHADEMSFREAVDNDLEGLVLVHPGWRWVKVRLFLSEQYKVSQPGDRAGGVGEGAGVRR